MCPLHVHPHALVLHVHDHRHQIRFKLVDLVEVLLLYLPPLPVVQREGHHRVLDRIFRHDVLRSPRNVRHLHVPRSPPAEQLRHLLVNLLVLLQPRVLASQKIKRVGRFVFADQRCPHHRAVDPVERNGHPRLAQEMQVEFEVVAHPLVDRLVRDEVVKPVDHAGTGANVPVPRMVRECNGHAEQLVLPPVQPGGLGVDHHHRRTIDAWKCRHQNGMSSS